MIVIRVIIHLSLLDLLGIEFHYFSMYGGSCLMTWLRFEKLMWPNILIFALLLFLFLISSFNINFLNKKGFVIFLIFFYIGLTQSLHLGYMFCRLTWVDSSIITYISITLPQIDLILVFFLSISFSIIYFF
jgi:hypothetical protein